MKCSLSLHGLFALSGHISTGHAANFSTHRKETIYVSGPLYQRLPPKSVEGLPLLFYQCDDR